MLLYKLIESLNSFSFQFLNIRKLNEMVCLNSHFFAIESLLKSRINMYLASPRSENVIFAVLYALFVNRSYNSVGN
jgi:hypothetical protein